MVDAEAIHKLSEHSDERGSRTGKAMINQSRDMRCMEQSVKE